VKVHHQGAAILTTAPIIQAPQATAADHHLSDQAEAAEVVVMKAVHQAADQVPEDKNIKLSET
jgi:hypothetical protein